VRGEATKPETGFFGNYLSGRERLDIARSWPVLFFIVAALLFCRQPYALIHPTLYAEDGSIFFKQQYEMGFAGALVTRYAGYVHFMPRLIAALCSWLPLEYIPLAYATVSLLVAAGTFTFFFAPGFRPIIDSDLLRACIVVGFTLMPNAEPLMKLAYINWYMLFFTSLLMIFSLPKQTVARWLFLIPAAMAAWSNPVTVVCLPLMLYRAWKAEDAGERLWWATLVSLTIGFALAAERETSKVAVILHEHGWMLALVHAIGYRVFCFFFFGSQLAYPVPWEGWTLATGVSLGLAAFSGWAAVMAAVKTGKSGMARMAPLILFYMIVALPMLFVLRKEWQRFLVTWNVECWHGGDRYFFCPTLLMGVLAGVVYERMFCGWVMENKRRCELSLLALVYWLGLHGAGFRMENWHTDERWSYYAGKIHIAEAQARQTGRYEVVHVESPPIGFEFDLIVR
jgi:hypothetical protein